MRRYIFLIIFFSGVIGRSVHLQADPPFSLSFSSAIFTDEGFWSHNAKNKTLFGRWRMDNFNPGVFSPLFTFLEYISFKTGGVSLKTARLPSLILGSLCIPIIYFITESLIPPFLFSISYFTIMYNRLALLETPLIFFLLLGLWQIKKERYFLAGLLTGAGAYIKLSSFFFIIPSLLFLILYRSKRKAARFLIAFFIAYLSYFLLFALTHRMEWNMLAKIYIVEKFTSPILHLKSEIKFLTGNSGFMKMPILYLLSISGIFLSFFRWRKLKDMEIFSIFWFISGCIFLGFFPYQPPRYTVLLIPPMVIISGYPIREIGKLGRFLPWLVGTFFFLYNTSRYMEWALNPSYSIVEISHRIKEITGRRAILGGEISSTLSLSNHLRSLPFLHTLNRKNLDRVSHLVLYGEDEMKYYRPIMEKERLKCVFLKRFSGIPRGIFLFKLEKP